MKVIFYQPVSFLRSAKKTNPFFDPVIDVCRKNGIDWEIWLPDARVEHGYEKSHVRDMRWFYFWDHLFYRIFHYVFRVNAGRAQVWAGFLLRQLTFHRFKADLVVSIAGCLVHVMKSFFPHTRAADIQHGVVYSSHKGYFDPQGRIWSFYWSYPEREFWLYGPGYANCFFKNPENHRWLDGRVKVVGDVVRHEVAETCEGARNLIVISGQFKPESDLACMLDQVRGIREFLKAFIAKYGTRYQVLIRHHPRFRGVAELEALHREFPQFQETKEPWSALYGRMYLHVTFSSTVVFDAASNGVPSYLLMPTNPRDPVLENAFWRDDYACPFFGMSLDEMMSAADNPHVRADTRAWYERFYAPFDEERCLRLIWGEAWAHLSRSARICYTMHQELTS